MKLLIIIPKVPKPLDAKGPATPKIYGSPNRFTKIQNTKTEFVYPKTPALQEILDVSEELQKFLMRY